MRTDLKAPARRSPGRLLAVALVCGAMTPLTQAQDARVYVSDSAAAGVVQVRFDPASSTVVIEDADRLAQIRDLALRENGTLGSSLIACDTVGGRLAYYRAPGGNGELIFDASLMVGPDHPDGLCLDGAGNIFVTSSPQDGTSASSQVWAIRRDPDCPNPSNLDCLPGGYRRPLGLVDPSVRVFTQFDDEPTTLDAHTAPESIVAQATSGILHAGDLLVLTTPGALVRYPAAQVAAFLAALAQGETPDPLAPQTLIHPAGASVPAERQLPADADPQSMAFGPGGELLIAMSDGRVVIFDADGTRRTGDSGEFVDFIAPSGPDQLRIAVGLQDGENRAYLTLLGRGELRRYSFAADGTGILDDVVSDLQAPAGVVTTNSSTVVAPAGTDVTVASTSILSTQFEKIIEAGLINTQVSVIADPREKEQSIPHDQPLHRPLMLNELRSDFPAIEIPAWARAFRLGDAESGTPSFILIQADSTAVAAGLLDHLATEEPILGYKPDCSDPDVTMQPFMLWAPDENDGDIVEGEVFIDITTGCGSVRGMSRSMSYFLAGVRVTQPLHSLAHQKLDALQAFIDSSACISQQTQRMLRVLLSRAQREFAIGRYSIAIQALRDIESLVLARPQAFSSCPLNAAGEIRARSRSAVFVLDKLP